MTLVELIVLIVFIIVWHKLGSRKPRILSSKELDAMLGECVGRSKKEVRQIQDRYLYGAPSQTQRKK